MDFLVVSLTFSAKVFVGVSSCDRSRATSRESDCDKTEEAEDEVAKQKGEAQARQMM